MSSWINKKKDDAASGGNDSSSFLSDFFGGSGGGFQLGDSATYSADNLDKVPAISFNQNIECISTNGSRRMVTMNDSGGFYDRRSYDDLQAVSMDESGTSLSVSEIQEDPSETSTYGGEDDPSETFASGHNEGTQPSLPSSQEMPSGGGSGMVSAAGGLGSARSVDRFTNRSNHTAVDDTQDDVQNATRALNALRSKHAALRDPSIRSSSVGGNGASSSSPATQAAVAAAK